MSDERMITVSSASSMKIAPLPTRKFRDDLSDEEAMRALRWLLSEVRLDLTEERLKPIADLLTP